MSRVLIYCLLCAFSISLLQAAPVKRSTAVFAQLFKSLEKLQNIIQTDTVELHSPSGNLSTCFLSALNCFKNETLLLRPLQNHISSFNLSLSHIRYFHPPPIPGASELTCPECTSYEKKSPKTFVEDFKTLLQQMYRLHSKNQKQ